NPDLKAELDMLLQAKLVPDTDVKFDDKSSLLIRDSSNINLNNYEEWLLSYVDNELTNEETADVERFLANNPAIQAELSLLQKAKLQTETIVFPDKKLLYRKEEKATVINIRWWRMAAAAVLFIGLSITVVVVINNRSNKGTAVVKNGTRKETPANNNNPVT